MRVYRYNPAISALFVHAPGRAPRLLGYFRHDAWIAAARAILADCRGGRIAKGFARSYGEVVRAKRFASHWELSEFEVGAWLGGQPEFLNPREGRVI